VGCQSKYRFEGGVPIITTIVAEYEFVEVGIYMFTTKTMVGPEAPALQEGKHPMYPLQWNMGCHLSNYTGIMPEFIKAGIRRMTVGDQRRAWRDISGDEVVNMRGVVAGNSREPDASGHGVQVFASERLGFLGFLAGPINDLDRADDEDFSRFQRVVGIIVGAERHHSLVNLDNTHQGVALRVDHRPPQLLNQKPSRAVGNPELPLQLLRRHPVGMSGHQVRRPKPGRQRHLGPVHHRSGSDRGLATAAPAFIGVGPALQQTASGLGARWAHEPVRPTPLEKEACTTRLVGKPLLEFKQGGLFPRHGVG